MACALGLETALLTRRLDASYEAISGIDLPLNDVIGEIRKRLVKKIQENT